MEQYNEIEARGLLVKQLIMPILGNSIVVLSLGQYIFSLMIKMRRECFHVKKEHYKETTYDYNAESDRR